MSATEIVLSGYARSRNAASAIDAGPSLSAVAAPCPPSGVASSRCATAGGSSPAATLAPTGALADEESRLAPTTIAAAIATPRNAATSAGLRMDRIDIRSLLPLLSLGAARTSETADSAARRRSERRRFRDRKSTRLNSSHMSISYAVFCLKKKKHRNSLIPFISPSYTTYQQPQ